MDNILNLVLLSIVFYIYGSYPTAFLISYFFLNKDITKVGSKNSGALNLWRLSKNPLLVLPTLILDVSKGFIPVIIIKNIFREDFLFLAFLGLLGHCYPAFSNLKGGRGVAAYIGILLAINPILAIYWIIMWIIVFYITKYIFIGAIFSTAILAIYVLVASNLLFSEKLLILISSCIVLVKHIEKVIRFLKGEEPKAFFSI